MTKTMRYSVILPSLLFVTLLLEGILAIYFRSLFITNQHAIVIQILPVVVFLIGLHLKPQWTYTMTFIIFLLYDAYYSPFLAFYTIAMMITFTIIRQFARIKQSFFRDFIVVAIGLLIVNSILYIEAFAIGYSLQHFSMYFGYKIVPTVLFNLLVLIICYLPLKKLFIGLEKDKKM